MIRTPPNDRDRRRRRSWQLADLDVLLNERLDDPDVEQGRRGALLEAGDAPEIEAEDEERQEKLPEGAPEGRHRSRIRRRCRGMRCLSE